MPKDRLDSEDPLELRGVAFPTEEDTIREMARCFTEEFLMLGYSHTQILALFRNPHYLGMNLVWEGKGEAFVKEVIGDVFAFWGKKIECPTGGGQPVPPPVTAGESLSLCLTCASCSKLRNQEGTMPGANPKVLPGDPDPRVYP